MCKITVYMAVTHKHNKKTSHNIEVSQKAERHDRKPLIPGNNNNNDIEVLKSTYRSPDPPFRKSPTVF